MLNQSHTHGGDITLNIKGLKKDGHIAKDKKALRTQISHGIIAIIVALRP